MAASALLARVVPVKEERRQYPSLQPEPESPEQKETPEMNTGVYACRERLLCVLATRYSVVK
jgi:hypothetical protein